MCPQCRDGFIEEVADNSSLPVERENNSDPLFSIIHRIMSDLPGGTHHSPRRSRQDGTANHPRGRSRSPVSFIIRSLHEPREEGAGTSSTSVGRLPRGIRGISARSFHFDLDDLMSSFLSSPRPPPVSQRRLAEIAKIAITQEHVSSNTQCSVCFDEFLLQESEIRQLPCNHLFHEKCIFPWLRINGTCPVCRASLIRGVEDEAADSEASPNGTGYGELKYFFKVYFANFSHDSRQYYPLHASATKTQTSRHGRSISC